MCVYIHIYIYIYITLYYTILYSNITTGWNAAAVRARGGHLHGHFGTEICVLRSSS